MSQGSGSSSPHLFFEDLRVGDSRELGSFALAATEIIAFARQFDPQPFHTDVQLAEESFFGGLVASGVHTFAAFCRLMHDGFVSEVAVVAGRGVRELRLCAPVRPGETIHGRVEIVEVQESPTRPSCGNVAVSASATKADGTQVLTVTADMLVMRRSSGS